MSRQEVMNTGNLTEAATPFGTLPTGEAVEMHTLANAAGVEVKFLNLGGIITSLKTPDRNGDIADITPGYDSLAGYLADTRYFGALVGRYANRIANARFELDGAVYQLPANLGRHQLHGGPGALNTVLWTVTPFAADGVVGAVLSHVSPNASGGFPGELRLKVTYTLTESNELTFDYEATTDAATPVNFTQHAYFNLGGHASGDILDHGLRITAAHYLPVDDELIPTGVLAPVQGTRFDFRVERPVRAGAALFGHHHHGAYDHCFALDGAPGALRPAARLHHAPSGRILEIETTEPGIQLYTGEHLPNGPVGKGGAVYAAHTSLALETQHFPNSPNEPRFPSTILRPDRTFQSRTIYRFGVA